MCVHGSLQCVLAARTGCDTSAAARVTPATFVALPGQVRRPGPALPAPPRQSSPEIGSQQQAAGLESATSRPQHKRQESQGWMQAGLPRRRGLTPGNHHQPRNCSRRWALCARQPSEVRCLSAMSLLPRLRPCPAPWARSELLALAALPVEPPKLCACTAGRAPRGSFPAARLPSAFSPFPQQCRLRSPLRCTRCCSRHRCAGGAACRHAQGRRRCMPHRRANAHARIAGRGGRWRRRQEDATALDARSHPQGADPPFPHLHARGGAAGAGEQPLGSC